VSKLNKILIMPTFIMAIIVILGGLAGFGLSEPDSEPTDPELLGEFILYDPGLGDANWYYIYPGTGHYYLIEGQGADLFSSFDPSAKGNQDKSFRLDNVDTDVYEYYDNYDDFLTKYGDAEPGDSAVDNILDSEIFWGLIVALLVATVVAGVKIFGNGLSEWSQRMIFIAGGWGAVWAFLSIGAYRFLLAGALGIFGSLLYTGLTLTFLVGLISEVSSGGD